MAGEPITDFNSKKPLTFVKKFKLDKLEDKLEIKMSDLGFGNIFLKNSIYLTCQGRTHNLLSGCLVVRNFGYKELSTLSVNLVRTMFQVHTIDIYSYPTSG